MGYLHILPNLSNPLLIIWIQTTLLTKLPHILHSECVDAACGCSASHWVGLCHLVFSQVSCCRVPYLSHSHKVVTHLLPSITAATTSLHALSNSFFIQFSSIFIYMSPEIVSWQLLTWRQKPWTDPCSGWVEPSPLMGWERCFTSDKNKGLI